MTFEQGYVFAVLAAALVLFVWGRWRYDLVAVAAMLAVVLAGIVPAKDAFTGLGHPAVITVAAVLIISQALRNAGIVDVLVRLLRPLRGHDVLMIGTQTVVVAVLSAFMNNVGALALMMPVALRNAYRAGCPPAKVLMPLSFGALLGGLTTLIGTPPNIIIASFRAETAGAPFGMFDFSPVGGLTAIAGIAFVTLIGWRLIPLNRRGRPDPENLFHIEDYITEARAAKGSPAIGKRVREIEEMGEGGVTVAGLIQGKTRTLVPSGFDRITEGDVLILEGDPTGLKVLLNEAKLELVAVDNLTDEELRSDEIGVVEAVVNPGSRIEGRTAMTSQLRLAHGLNLLALARHGAPTRRIRREIFQAGDVLLLQGKLENMPEKLALLGLLPLAERGLTLGQPQRLFLPIALFAAAILASVFGGVGVHISFTAAVAAMVLARLITLNEVYESVDWPVIILLAALFPVGAALEATGGTALIADAVAALGGSLGPVWILVLLLAATMFVSDVINNNATALLMAPIAVELADRLSVNADAYLMAVALGASCAFLTPIGHQANTLIMEPGGYRFRDYWRMGLPLELIILAIAVPMILIVWPLA